MLDVACGSGNQLIANYRTVAGARLVGIDHSLRMLRGAGSARVPTIGWVRADAVLLPITDSSFDYIKGQFAFHHLQDEPHMLGEAFRLLRTRRDGDSS